jgi:antitoxin (DNA-binding transcriptional repressor) of toxin-antitoxin stability system
MKSVQLSELGTMAEDVLDGETIEIRQGERVVAMLTPIREQSFEERIEELVRQGKAKRGTGKLPPDFLTRPLPKAERSVLEQLLEDRRSGR